MIDTSKYEGYTEDTWRKNLFGCLSQGKMPRNIDLDEVSEADAQLIVDAPILLAEVNRLRERLKRAYDWVNGAFFGNDSTMMEYTEYVCGGEEE